MNPRARRRESYRRRRMASILLFGDEGSECISDGAPKVPAEVEKVMRKK